MKTLTQALIASSLGLLIAFPTFAHHRDEGYRKTDRIMERIERQQRRISRGIESDELTRKEAKLLRRDNRDIKQLLRLFREDGRLSKLERRYLQKRLDRSSQQIKRFKHNDINRYVRMHERYGHGDRAHRL